MIPSVPAAVQQAVAGLLSAELKDFSFSGGGCINHGGQLKTSSGDFFLKWNDARKFSGMFEAEARGLKLLAAPGAIRIPKVIAFDEAGTHQYILMEFIDEKSQAKNYWENLGGGLASLHRQSSPAFGLDHDNYIGSLRQVNTPNADWINFFVTRRLQVQVELALTNRRVEHTTANKFEGLYKKLRDLLPAEKPALLHGDLWSGNLITDSAGGPVLIDPAVYYGNREAEIAFTTLFGGFSDRFYESYKKNFPLIPGFEKRLPVYNLYPLMVHVNLFGGGYLSQVVSILKHLV